MTENELKLSGMLAELEMQHNWLRTRCATLQAEIAVKDQRIKEFQAPKKKQVTKKLSQES